MLSQWQESPNCILPKKCKISFACILQQMLFFRNKHFPLLNHEDCMLKSPLADQLYFQN